MNRLGFLVFAWSLYAPLSNLYAFSGGTGTSTDPYLVSTAEELNTIGTSSAYWASYFKLTANINMSGYTGTSYHIIGNITTRFTGGFDGNGYVISNLTYTGTNVSYVGLFGYTQNAVIQNVQLVNVAISSTNGQNVGSLIGCQLYGTTANCSVSGTVSGGYHTGGLAGSVLQGTLNSCSSAAAVSGGDHVGCLAGNIYQSTVSQCSATGNVNGANAIGGLLGYSDTGTVSNCYARGAAVGTGGYIGGLIGYIQYGTVSSCYSTGAVSAGYGGWKGGLAGYSWEFESPCVFTACFWDTQTSGTNDGLGNINPDPAGITGLTTAQMKTQSTFTDAGWDFTTVWVRLYDGYPHLQWEPKYSGGKGTISDPYRISRLSDFYNMTVYPADWNKHFSLTTNVDLSTLTFSGAPIAPDTDNAVSGFQGTRFTGSFSGNGHVLQNLTLSAPTADFVGLFGWVYYGAQVSNLGLTNVSVSGRTYAGGLAGVNSGTLTNCYTTGTVNSDGNYAGGLAGFNAGGTLTRCTSSAGVSGSYYAGGLSGHNNASGTISRSSAAGPVNGASYIGGLIGENIGPVSLSYAVGSADGSSYVGGLIGSNSGSVSGCYASGAAAGHVLWVPPSTYYHSYYVGGLMGYNSGTVTNCYARGSATRQGSGGNLYDVGGLIGWNAGFAAACYSSGLVSGNVNVGGLIGYNTGTAASSFWDTETSNQPSSAGGTPKTTLEMKTESTFTSGGWDFSWVDGDAADWVLWMEGQQYPELTWQPPRFAGGSGTSENPWKIARAQHLLYLAYNESLYGSHFLMTADINMSAYTGMQYKCIGNSEKPFTGTFDGGGHTVSHLNYFAKAAVTNVGMFGYTSEAVIRNLGLEGVSIYTEGDSVGGLIGTQYRGIVSGCFTTGTVEGIHTVGGLVGDEYGSIEDSYSLAAVYGHGSAAGGLAGAITGYMTDGVRRCYSAGSVKGVDYVGGLIGHSNEGLVLNSVWDMQTSNQETSAGGIGLLTEEMKMRSSFIGIGWDFLDETANGTNDCWRMCVNGVSYPLLTWSFSALGDFACPDGVALADFAYLARHWLQSSCTQSNQYCGWADMSISGTVEVSDLAVFVENWLRE
ncbi:MAG TPA: GLUG motif-containing protein [Anaerohalosphaeraceae bacterium]|nr:GLUG motif-containing protein [Anaerohalosphaeraceae bacterium]HPP55783.1 GLUG motif-containing protein [Anaerohalosphaeraceae bacterium]